MLYNTTYMGDLWLQKKYTVDHLGKKQRINRGEVTQYLVQGNYESIISRETFEAVQQERIRRAGKHNPPKDAPPRHLFDGMITCGCCGGYYRHKKVNTGTSSEKPVWICDTFNSRGKTECLTSRQIPEYALIASCAEAVGASSFDGLEMRRRVKRITAGGGNRLVFELDDGERVEQIWQYKQRRNVHEPSSDNQ